MKKAGLPTYMQDRPIWGGYHVPWFVAWYKDGKLVDDRTEGAVPNFPTIDFGKLVQAHKRNLCWVCGHPMGSNKAFVFGPASAITGQTGEPPCHLACAGYAVVTCPFMLNPERGLTAMKRAPKEGVERAEVANYNPGMSIIWVTKRYSLTFPKPKAPIFEPLGPPVAIQFWHRGAPATYKQIADGFQHAIKQSGLANVMPTREIAMNVYNLMKWAGEPP